MIHPDGYIELKDRATDIITVGDQKISSIEIENVMYRHPAILEVAVVGKEDVKSGEQVCAYVTLKVRA